MLLFKIYTYLELEHCISYLMLIFVFFFRMKMHKYTKMYIDNLFNKALYKEWEVPMIKLTAEDIENYRL